ncbi:hypothetical protein LXL04_011253 [Taraxacum kok-saghyz]
MVKSKNGFNELFEFNDPSQRLCPLAPPEAAAPDPAVRAAAPEPHKKAAAFPHFTIHISFIRHPLPSRLIDSLRDHRRSSGAPHRPTGAPSTLLRRSAPTLCSSPLPSCAATPTPKLRPSSALPSVLPGDADHYQGSDDNALYAAFNNKKLTPKLSFDITRCKKRITSSSKMAASSFSKCFRVGHSLLSSSTQILSQETISTNNLLLQQIRTFIQMRTNLKVVDNSGAKRVMCIQALKGKKGARLGDTIVASVKEAQPGGKVKKGQVVYGVVVRAAMQKGRCDGSEVKFDDNAVVLVNKQGEPIGTRVFGPVPHELRKKKHVKILSLAQHIA